MSTCISRAGEYSEHTYLDDNPYVCGLCWAFDEDAALERIAELEAMIREGK